jgi:hypothetical protein
MEEAALTTAKYFETLTIWYEIMSSRSMWDALKKDKSIGYTAEKLDFLENIFIPLIQQQVPVHDKIKWLPSQSSVLLCTQAVLDLYDIYVANGK